jgi:hypothetical protein
MTAQEQQISFSDVDCCSDAVYPLFSRIWAVSRLSLLLLTLPLFFLGFTSASFLFCFSRSTDRLGICSVFLAIMTCLQVLLVGMCTLMSVCSLLLLLLPPLPSATSFYSPLLSVGFLWPQAIVCTLTMSHRFANWLRTTVWMFHF